MKDQQNTLLDALQVLGVTTLSTWRRNAKHLALIFQALGRTFLPQALCLGLALLCLTNCKKEDFLPNSSKYSTKYRVMCGFNVASYKELQPAVGGFGVFAQIRQVGSEIYMECEGVKSDPLYKMDALQKDFRFGLGGLIIGNDFDGIRCCFDLACPNCDQAQWRLKVQGGQAKCNHCGIVYALQNDTYFIDGKGNGLHPDPRPLYQYHIDFNGTMVQMYN